MRPHVLRHACASRATAMHQPPHARAVQLGPLRNVTDIAEVSGCLSGAGLVMILTVCLTMYGAVSFEAEEPSRKTLSGRELPADPLQTSDGCAATRLTCAACSRCEFTDVFPIDSCTPWSTSLE